MMRRRDTKFAKSSLDKVLPEGRGRGRPVNIPASEVVGRAEHYRDVLQYIWDLVWPSLSLAKTEDEVKRAFEKAAPYERGEFVGSASLVLSIVNETRFP